MGRAAWWGSFVCLLAAGVVSGCSDDAASTGAGGSAVGGASSGGAGPASCEPGDVVDCFSGTAAQLGVGRCVAGEMTCALDGSGFGPCEGEIPPAVETCGDPADEDCDGLVDESGVDCACEPGGTRDCYTGAQGTRDVGPCKAGLQTCNAAGDGWGACAGQVTPKPETCDTPVDDDCDGQVNEGGAGCLCPPGELVACYSGPSGTEGVGACVAGSAQCNDEGTDLGPCSGEVVPTTEACLDTLDADCDGTTSELTGCACTQGAVVECYSGPAATNGVGVCHSGQRSCLGGTQGYGACTGEVKPSAEVCATSLDENCDGVANDGCPCMPGQLGSCYTGPAGTDGVGVCHAGTRTCNANGLGWGPCNGEVVPVSEVCSNASDDDCDGVLDEKQWAETSVDTHTPGPGSALAVDGAGGVHALYHDTTFDSLVYAYKPFGGVFARTTVDTHSPGDEPAMVVDGAGGVHALYHDTTFDHLVYAFKPSGGAFAKTTVDVHSPGSGSRLAVDAAGGVHALYLDATFGHLDYGYKPAGGTFSETTVDVHAPGASPSLVVDAAGGVHALYLDTTFGDLDYAYKPAGGAFVETTVDSHTPGSRSKIVVDAAGGVHALYVDTFFGDLDYAYKPAGGVFTETTVDTHAPSDDPALVVDGVGGVHALYVDTFFGDLDYAYKPAGGAFTETTVDTHLPGGAPKLAVGATGRVSALYYDTFFNDLDFSEKPAGGVFTETTVDVHAPGGDARLVVDAAGGAHALHHDTFFDDLDYAYRCP